MVVGCERVAVYIKGVRVYVLVMYRRIMCASVFFLNFYVNILNSVSIILYIHILYALELEPWRFLPVSPVMAFICYANETVE